MTEQTDSPFEVDAVIIGAGVLGGAIAVELARRDRKSVV